MARRAALLVLAFVGVAGFGSGQEPLPVAPVASPPPFDLWLADLRSEALARGIRAETVATALSDLQPVEQILDRDRTQAEFTLDLEAYLRRRLARGTVRTARQMHTRHRGLLRKVSDQYGVPPRILVAIWGLESNFGRFAGVRPTITALATLAYDPRRSTLFRSELFSALEILDRGDVDLERLKGSWAGAIGQPQFMPSSYLLYAQDFDGDGRRDIWTSQADVFASIAFYLQQHGWVKGQIWGREVRVPAAARAKLAQLPQRTEGCRARRMMTEPMPLAEWARLGLRTAAGRPLPKAALDASLVSTGSRDFLVYRNYDALLDYNCAHSYALSIGVLADRIP
ncbi:MAG TPA: lytic murein transglycosylase [Vicinamibacterales bacterium]|nr:lytic murein transglycosylase [Vicinamibacterales bacterium]